MDEEFRKRDELERRLQDQSSEPSELPLEYLRTITNNFSDKRILGQGGFGKVYKGILQNGEMVAVKKLDQLKPGIQERQFENEVCHLMRLKHPNIVRFLGYCYETQNELVEYNGKFVFAEKQQRLLCLEYLPKGSLDKHISDAASGLDWCTRYKIIKGICCGLHYLHKECQHENNASIIHMDLKPANILLDDNMVPKVADFGLSKLFDDKKTQARATTFFGSFGYMAPEYMYGRIISTKADIYSLGVIIIEIITGGGINSDITTSRRDFVETVLKNWKNRLQAAPSVPDCQVIESCLEIGLSCIKFDRYERPTSREIIEKLNRLENRDRSANNEEKPTADQIISNPKELVEISPLQLRFSLELDERARCLVKLTNKTEECVAFYFGVARATNNYYIEPTMGLLLPESTLNVVVTMEEQHELPLDSQCNDEFVVQSAIVGMHMLMYMLMSKAITVDMFNNMSSNMVFKVKLTVAYVPLPPPQLRVLSEESSSPQLQTTNKKTYVPIKQSPKRKRNRGKHSKKSQTTTHKRRMSNEDRAANLLKKSQSSMHRRKIRTENEEANFLQADSASTSDQESCDQETSSSSIITETAAGILRPGKTSACDVDCELVDFIREILNAAFLNAGSISSLLERFDGSSILEPCILEELNLNVRLVLGEDEGLSFREKRKLAFDRVNELLSEKCAYYFNAGYDMWLLGILVMQKLSAEEIYKEITKGINRKGLERLDKIISQDFKDWINDFKLESYATESDISTFLLGYLIDEMIYDLLADYTA